MSQIVPNDNIKTMAPIMPVIYAAEIPFDTRWKDGWLKIGEARKQLGTDRLAQEGHEIDSDLRELWEQNALFEGNPVEYFRDKDFHKYLKSKDIPVAKRRSSGRDMEVFQIDSDTAKSMLHEFRDNRGLAEIDGIQSYTLREEQDKAVNMAYEYAQNHPKGEFLWNAKPRFGKTLATYDLAKKLGAKKVLIVTNRPAIANSWFDDYAQYIGTGYDGYFFVSEVQALKEKQGKGVMSYQAYKDDSKTRVERGLEPMNIIYFVSLENLKGSKYFAEKGTDKLREISITDWDLLVIDECHEGVDTTKTDTAFNYITRNFTLHLSGTPFKALANEKFGQDAIFNWTYADEQAKKAKYRDSADNPYAVMPKLNMYTYKMSDAIIDKVSQGTVVNGENVDFAFNLNDFFEVKELSNGSFVFVHNDAVNAFLDSLSVNEKYPFSTDELRNELKHTLWLLDRVESARALAKKLESHPVFGHGNYKIVLAAGDGKIEKNDNAIKAYNSESDIEADEYIVNAFDRVKDAISKYDKTITLSVGQLTTGITIPEWTAVLVLSNVSSPSLYMQAAFRAQNPWRHITGTDDAGVPIIEDKTNAYVFDFDPARTLVVFEKFANNLNPKTANGGGTFEERQDNIKELLNFFPVIGEDEDGTMVALNVEQIMTIPHQIRSREVVCSGFMSSFLFTIPNVFNLPKEVTDTLSQVTPAKEVKGNKKNAELLIESSTGFNVDDDGNVTATEEHTKEVVSQLFGDKKYTNVSMDDVSDMVNTTEPDATDNLTETLKDMFTDTATKVIEDAQNQYGDNMKKSDNNQITSQLKSQATKTAHDITADFKIQHSHIEKERDEALEQIVNNIDTTNKSSAQINAEIEQKQAEVNQTFEQKQADLKSDMLQKVSNALNDFEEKSKATTAKIAEEKQEQRRATDMMEDVRDRLRGFSRTIPSFLMAYSEDEQGNPREITLADFDKIIPDEVFKEVTSISLEQFRQLRDGYDYIDEEGNQRHFDGGMFDPVVFNDAVAEFIKDKYLLADYFDDDCFIIINKRKFNDIFDLIPPQKTNQIFTPKKVVKQMADLLEEQNPNCFDDADATFIDPYMKSGMYITEIVKRLYQSEELKRKFPDKTKRLQHIFDKQVYGLAPTKIIYAIATSYILGFAKKQGLDINTDHFALLDSQEYAQGKNEDGLTLAEKLDELFGEGKGKGE